MLKAELRSIQFKKSRSARARRRGRVFVLRLSRVLQTLDYLHLRARARRVFELRVEAREVVMRLRVFGIQARALLKRRARPRVILLLEIDSAERDVRVRERRHESHGAR